MPLPDWAKQQILADVDALALMDGPASGTVFFTAQMNYAHGSLGSLKVKVTSEEEFRPPEKK